jgi:heat shock protein HtpX
MKRVMLFLATNLAILVVLSIVVNVLGLDRYLTAQGGNLTGLLVFAAIFGFGGAFISLAISKWMAKRAMGVQVIEQPRNQTEAWLVAVSTGLLQRMNQNEVEAVLGHEVSHVANGDMVTLTLIQGVVNTFVIFLARIIGNLVDRTFFRSENGRGPAYFVAVIVSEIVLGILASIIVAWFSRYREFRADKGGANLAGTQKMIGALEKLKSAHEPLPAQQFAAFGITAGEGPSGFKRLFLSHPPLDERIAALRNAGN